jgi:hypothetical protein
VTLAALVAATTLVLDRLTHGWYEYFIVGELAGQPWDPKKWIGFWRLDLYDHLRPLVWLTIAALIAAVVSAVMRRQRRRERGTAVPAILGVVHRGALGVGYELTAVAGLLLAAWFSRLHTGGYLNVLMPAYAGCALAGGLAFARVRRLGPLPTILAAGLVLAQLTQLAAVPDHALAHKSARAAGAELIRRLRGLPGPVLVLSHPWYGTLAGKGSFAQSDAIFEVLRSDDPRGSAYLRRELRDSLDRYRIQAVVLDHPPPSWMAPQLARDFVLADQAITPTVLRPPADLRSGPTFLYLRRPRSRAGL